MAEPVAIQAYFPDPDDNGEYVPVILMMDEDDYLEAVAAGREMCEQAGADDPIH